MDFCGRSMVVGPDGEIVARAGDKEEILTAGIDYSSIQASRSKRDFLSLRRPEAYIS